MWRTGPWVSEIPHEASSAVGFIHSSRMASPGFSAGVAYFRKKIPVKSWNVG